MNTTVKIFDEKESEQDELILKLERPRFGNKKRVVLVAVDKEGKRLLMGNILTINTKGEVLLHAHCRVEGVSTDSNGRIIVHEA